VVNNTGGPWHGSDVGDDAAGSMAVAMMIGHGNVATIKQSHMAVI
jgi:hypothetical protein